MVKLVAALSNIAQQTTKSMNIEEDWHPVTYRMDFSTYELTHRVGLNALKRETRTDLTIDMVCVVKPIGTISHKSISISDYVAIFTLTGNDIDDKV